MSAIRDRNNELLLILKCKTMSEFQQYKDTFLARVMHRSDRNSSFWKEIFFSSLPHLFGEKVRNKIKQKYRGLIPYDNCTYGDLISEINAVGIELCNDLKLRKQIKRERLTSKRRIRRIL
ncbi:hypothetical protein CFOL_v3_28686 [Cephalotus follicularis]|uniref:UBN2 domain-containing protein n=1 Tax=Cephalotus follicularis TaxID=3775 RepID=A0A1Q3CYT2_CEPFO|nr:hypothetical protein CFOL_v3_28686 [Cephalotus follicularis]